MNSFLASTTSSGNHTDATVLSLVGRAGLEPAAKGL